jgi:hypothetical protein
VSDDYEQRTFLPDDSASKANWPAPKPAKAMVKDKVPVTEWLPGAIILLSLVICVVVGIALG